MTAIAEKLKRAGVDVLGSRFTIVCIDKLKENPDSLVGAWSAVGREFGYEFLRGLLKDMGKPLPEERARYRPPQIVVTPEQVERRRKLQNIIRSKYKNSLGVAWSDVGWHELSALTRDGNEASALLSAGPAGVPNDGRTVGQVLGIRQVDQIIKTARAEAQNK